MEISSSVEQGIKVVSVTGFLQTDSVGEFREKFAEETAADDRILLDCIGLEYLDSSGLAALVSIFKNLATRQAKLVIFGLPESILRVVRFTKLDQVFTLADNREDAIQKVSA